ncbi:site-specific integrase [Rhizobium rhizogenes]|uniref:tyrosine-type recombinase/integrase n=1 Tax=Rhizobium rhizogenes TaxID=359 RepID=UPI00193E908B|nr:tyrosine-type recombinase/integrase [Rhizobium rhizogenes]QRM36980.1 site-specific integrase [Rhizobium rhizogenes]
MPLKLKRDEKSGIFYVTGSLAIWRNGQPHSLEVRRSTKVRDEAQADAIRRQIENEVAERNITGREPTVTFRAAAEKYVKDGGEARFLRASHKEGDPFRLHSRFDAIAAKPIDQISEDLINGEGKKFYPNDSTRRRQWHGPIIAVMRVNKFRPDIKRPDDGEKRTHFLRPDQALTLLGHISRSRFPNPWSPALATFLFGQGARVGETMAIDGRDDVSLEHRYAILRDTKNGKERMVNLCPRVVAAISTLPNLGKKGPLFLRYDGRPYEEKEGRGYKLTFWTRAVKAMDFDTSIYTPHVARHSWATWFYSQTKDVVRLKAEGGWESDEWERYVKLANPSIGRLAAKLGFSFDPENEERSNFAESLRYQAEN